jgi:hypothetical protein
LVQLSNKGDKLLRDLVIHHRNELRESAPQLTQALKKIMTISTRSAAAKKSSEDEKKPRRSRAEGAMA